MFSSLVPNFVCVCDWVSRNSSLHYIDIIPERKKVEGAEHGNSKWGARENRFGAGIEIVKGHR